MSKETMQYKWWPVAYMDKKPEDLPPAALKVIEAVNRLFENADENEAKQQQAREGSTVQ